MVALEVEVIRVRRSVSKGETWAHAERVKCLDKKSTQHIGSGSVSEIGLGHCRLAGSCQVSRELRTRRGRARGQKTESWGETSGRIKRRQCRGAWFRTASHASPLDLNLPTNALPGAEAKKPGCEPFVLKMPLVWQLLFVGGISPEVLEEPLVLKGHLMIVV